MGNIFIDEYAKNIGPIGVAIYSCLKRHANSKTRIAFPSYELISKELGVNPRTVLRHIVILKAYRFIEIKKEKYRGRWLNNIYYLTYSRDWLKKPYDSKSYGKNNLPYDNKSKNDVTQSHINNTNNKKTKRFELKPDFNKNNPLNKDVI